MKFFVASVLAFVAAVVAQDPFSINTPTNVQYCVPVLLTWTGGQAPYHLSINAPDGNGQLVQSTQDISGNSFTWTPTFGTPTQVGLTLIDSTGARAQTASFVIQGDGTSCVSSGSAPAASSSGAAPPVSSGPATPGSTTAPPSSTTPAPGSSSRPASSSPSASRSAPAAGASSSAPASNAAMPTQLANMGVAGFIGAAVAVVLA